MTDKKNGQTELAMTFSALVARYFPSSRRRQPTTFFMILIIMHPVGGMSVTSHEQKCSPEKTVIAAAVAVSNRPQLLGFVALDLFTVTVHKLREPKLNHLFCARLFLPETTHRSVHI